MPRTRLPLLPLLPLPVRTSLNSLSPHWRAAAALALVPTMAAATWWLAGPARAADGPPAAPATGSRAALTVMAVQPQQGSLPLAVVANGSIAAWQEAVVGAEAQGLRLTQVHVSVGDRVRRGQVLASFAADMPRADLSRAQAALAEAEAALAEAAINAQRARELQPTGAVSAQQVLQAVTAERTASARVDSQRAALAAEQLRLAHTQVLAPDEGVISSRGATLGAVAAPGQELFRLIRQGRLEWRAEVPASELARLKPGMAVRVSPAGGGTVQGRVRMVGPTVDPATRNGLVYVDLPQAGQARAGMFARGEFLIGDSPALTLPQGAVLLRDGFAYVFVLQPDSRVRQLKVGLGRRQGEQVEVTQGLQPGTRVVASGGSFLADGDLVKVVQAPPPVSPATAPPSTPSPTPATTPPSAPPSPRSGVPGQAGTVSK